MAEKKAWRRRRKSSAEKGFTLVELLVVCLLLGIMISFSIPALRDAFFSDPLRSSTRKIIGLVNGVRELALRTQQPYFLHISRSENRLWYIEDDPMSRKGDSDASRRLLLPEGVRIKELSIADKDVSAMEKVAVWITRQGYMHEIGIRLEDDAGQTLSLKFLPFTDSVRITDSLAKAQ